MPANPVVLHARITLLHLAAIDTASQSWSGEVQIDLEAVLPKTHPSAFVLEYLVPNVNEYSDHPVFKLIPSSGLITNCYDVSRCEMWLRPVECLSGCCGFIYSLRIEASFRQRFDLRMFPMDTQRLLVSLKLQQVTEAVHFSTTHGGPGREVASASLTSYNEASANTMASGVRGVSKRLDNPALLNTHGPDDFFGSRGTIRTSNPVGARLLYEPCSPGRDHGHDFLDQSSCRCASLLCTLGSQCPWSRRSAQSLLSGAFRRGEEDGCVHCRKAPDTHL
jgi:hypothetical protein